MNQKSWDNIRNFYFCARARVRVNILLAIVWVFAGSTGLLSGENTKQTFPTPVKNSKPNPDLERWQKNRELAIKNTSGIEKALMDSLQTDASPIVRQGAAQQLGNYSQNPLVVRTLADALRDDSEKLVRYAAALSLGLSPTFKAITALERASNDPDPDLRRQIAFSLKRHRVGGNKRKAEMLLKKLQKDPDESVRLMAGVEK